MTYQRFEIYIYICVCVCVCSVVSFFQPFNFWHLHVAKMYVSYFVKNEKLVFQTNLFIAKKKKNKQKTKQTNKKNNYKWLMYYLLRLSFWNRMKNKYIIINCRFFFFAYNFFGQFLYGCFWKKILIEASIKKKNNGSIPTW